MVTTVTDNSPQSINTSLFSLDREVQEVKKTADALNDKLSGIDTESGVISVNGKQGIVELNASDVDALPSSTVIPTRTSQLTNDSGFITSDGVGSSFVPVTRKVNDKQLNTDITLTASDVGALPNTTIIPTTTSELTNDSGFITSSDSITGNAATATTADKVKNALTINGKTYDGSEAVDAGVQTIANGGTGQTTQADINKAFVGGLPEGNDVVTDGTMFVSSWASDNGFADTNATNVPYKRKFSRVWDYIKGKISSVLGLTASNYGGKAATAGTADNATKATQDGSGNVITSTYLPLSGGAMTGNISYRGSKSTDEMIKFINNVNDAYRNGIVIGGGGATIIGGGESSDVLKDTLTSGGDELMKIGNDDTVEIWTNLQDGIASGKKFTFGVDGNITTPLGTVALKSELENTFQDHLIGYIRNKPIYRKVILNSTEYNVHNADIMLVNLGGYNRKFIGSGGYVKYSINDNNYRFYPINSKSCAVEIFDQDGFVYLESTDKIVGKNIDIYAWIDYMQY